MTERRSQRFLGREMEIEKVREIGDHESVSETKTERNGQRRNTRFKTDIKPESIRYGYYGSDFFKNERDRKKNLWRGGELKRGTGKTRWKRQMAKQLYGQTGTNSVILRMIHGH